MPFYIIFEGDVYGFTISFKCYGYIYFPDSFYKILVANKVGSVLIVKKEHASEI